MRKEASGASPISRKFVGRAQWSVPGGYILEDAVYSGLGRPYLVERRNEVEVDGPYSVTFCFFLPHVDVPNSVTYPSWTLTFEWYVAPRTIIQEQI